MSDTKSRSARNRFTVNRYPIGTATHTTWVRLDQRDKLRVVGAAAQIGVPVTEFFRILVELFFEDNPDMDVTSPAATGLTPRQIESLAVPSPAVGEETGAGQTEQTGKYDLLGKH